MNLRVILCCRRPFVRFMSSSVSSQSDPSTLNATAKHQGSWSTSVDSKGEYKRKDSIFRNWVRADPTSEFPAAPGRYHLYVSLACPWAHRTLVVRALKGLEDIISYTVVDWFLGPGGWRFTDSVPLCEPDPVAGKQWLREIYLACDPDYKGNITVPVLFDKVSGRIVNNESSEIIRMLNTEFSAWAKRPTLDLYPEHLRAQIDDINAFVYPNVNNGVYRCGFAQSQEAYERAFDELFGALDTLEQRLGTSRMLVGNTLTEADVRLFTTLVRFDAVYVQHFKCNGRRIVDYPNLWNYTKDIYRLCGVADTVDMYHIKYHYMGSHKTINPLGIIPKGPFVNFSEAHDRDRIGALEVVGAEL